jgi:hypothetical protein
VISCEGRTDLAPLTMTLPTKMLRYASNRPSSAASRCSATPNALGGSSCGCSADEYAEDPPQEVVREEERRDTPRYGKQCGE